MIKPALVLACPLFIWGCSDSNNPLSVNKLSDSGSDVDTGGIAENQMPDLIPGPPPPPANLSLKCGSIFTQPANTIRILNFGNQPAHPPIKVQFGLWDAVNQSWFPLLTWEDISRKSVLHPNESVIIQDPTPVQLDCNAPVGSYQFMIRIDSDNSVKELNEVNNSVVSLSSLTLYR